MLDSDSDIEQRLSAAALRYLSAREHTAQELQQKLTRKFGPEIKTGRISADEIDHVISQLTRDGLQSDERYVEVAIRSRIRKGYGPYYIEQELRYKGIDEALVRASEAWQDADWLALAADFKDRRFPEVGEHTRYEDPKSWQKALRTFKQRGFSSADIARVLSA